MRKILFLFVLLLSSCQANPPAVVQPGQEPGMLQGAVEGFSDGQNPLSNHDTYITFSDVVNSFEAGTLVKEGASVPEVFVCKSDSAICDENEILIYFIDAESLTSPGDEDIVLIRSSDGGKTWSEKENVTLEGKLNDGPAVDPSVVLLENGKMRMYFYGPEGVLDPFTKGENSVYSALSDDGVNFTVEEGIRVTAENLTDPDVVEWNSKWYMAYSMGQSSGLAVSDDGLNFEDLGEVSENVGGVPGLYADADGLRIYGCSTGGIATAVSTDADSFVKDSSKAVDLPGGVCDPSIDYSESLGYVFVYKLVAP